MKTLERILSGVEGVRKAVKDAGKSAIKFCKDNARVGIMIGAGIIGGYALSGERAEGGSLKITNSSVALGDTYAYNQHKEGSNEGNDIYDTPYNSGSPASLHIYIKNDTNNADLTKDSRPINSITPFDIQLKAKDYITNADNSLKFQVGNGDGALDHRFIIAYDTSKDINDVNNIHEIPKNGDIVEVPLPNLVNQPAGIYANWRVEFPRIVEGDINEDGKCDFKDYAILANEWKQTSSPTTNGGNYLISDLNLDRVTNEKDLAILMDSWLETE